MHILLGKADQRHQMIPKECKRLAEVDFPIGRLERALGATRAVA